MSSQMESEEGARGKWDPSTPRLLRYAGEAVLYGLLLLAIGNLIYPRTHVVVSLDAGPSPSGFELDTREVSFPVDRAWIWQIGGLGSGPNATIEFLRYRQVEVDRWYDRKFDRYGDRLPERIMDSRPLLVFLDDLEMGGYIELTPERLERRLATDFALAFLAVVLVFSVALPALWGAVTSIEERARKRSHR